ncbi:MAG: hypothetical protein M4579_005257 [Chaenotheca gracillima]|nr:MAG: hypothetical protein M4579_005257 [Chaenotheca gracillima]
MKTYIVEHIDPELGPWSTLEYIAIARESAAAGSKFCLSSVSESLEVPSELRQAPGVEIDHRSIESVPSIDKQRVCLLDPAASQELDPADAEQFDMFLFGGILDRTSELRKKGYNSRRLGPKQMTTDTAVRVTRMVIQDKIPLTQIPYVDDPDIKIDVHESTEMPFRYVADASGKPMMPEGMIELIKLDADKGFEDLL